MGGRLGENAETEFIGAINRKTILSSVQNKDQLLSVTDIVSEGPIHGLVRGAASIFLDDAPASDEKNGGQTLSSSGALFSFDGTTTVTTSAVKLTDHTSSPERGTKFLQLMDFMTLPGIDAEFTTQVSPDQIKITAPSNFFKPWMKFDLNRVIKPYIQLSINNVIYFIGTIRTDFGAATELDEVMAYPIGHDLAAYPKFVEKTDGEYTIHIHASLEIATIIDDEITLRSASTTIAPIPTGTFKCNISDSRYNPGSQVVEDNIISDWSKYKGFSYQFRKGVFNQTPIEDLYQGSGAVTITKAIGTAFEYGDNTPDITRIELAGMTWPTVWPYVGPTAAGFGTAIEKTSTQLGLTSATARQVDEVKVIIAYPSGLVSISKEDGDPDPGVQAYLIEINIDDGTGFTGWQNINEEGEFYYHVSDTNSDFYIQEDLSLERFKPFKDFKLKFTKATRDDRSPRADGTYADDSRTVSLESTLQTISCIIRERLTYPFTALVNMRVNAETFNKIPKRSYHCKGREILVPSNYMTRDETNDGVATYKRNPTTGQQTSVDQDWDGLMRYQLVYCNNPAWVFFDILSNSRYGLGAWLQWDDIDKYSLYRIARYCDELVPDGKGKGTKEPRFTANLYLSKKTDSYKVLKDMATIFRAILYWSEGSIMPVTDMAKDPVYNFTKGNVINGAFRYEGTGSKVRTNQVGVTWNNPDNDYVPEVLIVEDRDNIVKTGKLITEESVAFGCTSMGQATRYGRWKLWTAINQTEIVTFKTAISAAFLAPGDIVNIQDADRYDITYSGRVSNTQDEDQELIVKLDRDVTLNSGSTYTLSVLIDGEVAHLAQDKATIEVASTDTDFVRGAILPLSLYDDDADIDNELEASDIQDTDGKIVQIHWAPYTHVETKDVTAATIAATQPVSSLTVDAAFSTSPLKETIWALKEIDDGVEVAGSKKLYKILSIKEEGKNTYGITAVEHYNEKFDSVDIDFKRPYVDSILTPSTFVPPPTNLTVTMT